MRTTSSANKMVIVPASATVPEGLTFTVGQITWTTRGGGFTTTVSEGTQIQSGMTSAPTTRMTAPSARPPLPLYKGKKIDCSDLLQVLDRADSKLLEASQLVDGILRQPDRAALTDFFKSHRPTRVVTHERLGTSLTITSTPSGRSVELKANPEEDYPCGLNNSAECQGVRTSIRAHLIAAMGQTATLLKRVQAGSHTEATSDQTHRSRTSP